MAEQSNQDNNNDDDFSHYGRIVDDEERFESILMNLDLQQRNELNLGNGRQYTRLCPSDISGYYKDKSLGFFIALLPNTVDKRILKADLELIIKYLKRNDKSSIKDVLKYKSRFRENIAIYLSDKIYTQYS